ncbi:uncharacterized protein [Cherax quadricarinatus]
MPELRVAALQSYRRVGCPHSKAPWKILEDVTEKIEVRIAAYTSLVPCAIITPGFFTRINRLLEREEVNQVGSYIWTHVHNLVENPSPSDYDRQLAKLAAQHTLPTKFSINTFRSSQNYQYAQFSEILNLGGSLDSDVIFNTDSYIPRQVSVNLTLDVLDKSLNVFEFGGDFSGLEDIIEGYFGKEGYFGNEEMLNVLQNLRPKKNIIRNDKIQEFQKLYDETKKINEVEELTEEESKASVYLRIFGNEVVYIENLLKSNPMRFLNQLIDEFSSPKSFQVMDQEYISPTLLGFPLKLRLNATGSVTFNNEETVQAQGSQGFLIEVQYSPSAVIAIDETLAVEGYCSSSGIRRTSTQIARTHFGGKVTIENNGQIAEAKIDIPKSEVTKLSSSITVALFKSSINGWEEQKAEMPVEQNYCSPESLSNVLGLEVCSSLSYGTHNINGEAYTGEPYHMDFKVTKTDTFNYYKLYVKKQENVLEGIFDTPGSSIDRKVHFLFNVRPNNDGGYIAIRGMGYGIEGQYENTQSSKKLALKYREDSKISGAFEISLLEEEERTNHKYIPKILLILGSDVFTLDGNLLFPNQEDEGLEATWELEGIWHKTGGILPIAQKFVSTTGNFFIGHEKLKFQLASEYGRDHTQINLLSLAVDSSTILEQGKEKTKGYVWLESSQAEANMKVDFEYQPGHAEVNTNITVKTVQIASEIIMKKIMEGDDKDCQLTVSFSSSQLDMNYLGQVIYKETKNAFHVEADIMFDTVIQSKFLITYLLEREPLHLLAGLHFHLNDYEIEFGHNIDFSEPDHAVVRMSSTVGQAVAAFLLEVDYKQEQPFIGTLELYGGYDTHRAAALFHVTSDQAWQNFIGRSNLTWFDWSYSIEYTAVIEAANKNVKVVLENNKILQIITKTSPDYLLEFLVWNSSDEEDPAFQMKFEKQVSPERQMYGVDITTHVDHLFQAQLQIDSEKTFSCSLRLLESEVIINGEYKLPNVGVFEGSTQARITLPSGQVFSSNLSLNHFSDDTMQSVGASFGYGNDVIKGHMTLKRHDGWFEDDVTSFNLNLTTPLSQLHDMGITFEIPSDTSSVTFVEINVDEIKIRGEAQLSNPTDFEVKLLYEDGNNCDSYIHIYHRCDTHHSESGASLALTDSHNPWKVEANTTFDFSGWEKSFDVELSFQIPMLEVPFQLHGMCNVSDDHFGFEILTGMEEKVSLSFFGKQEGSWNEQKVYGLSELNTSWTEPLLINVTVEHNIDSFSINIDFQSSWEFISSWTGEFSTNYSSLEETNAHLYLTHNVLQVTVDLVQNFSVSGFSQHVEGSVNTLTITYDIVVDLDENFVPINAKGHLSLLNLFDHNFDLTFSHTEEEGPHVTQISLSWDDQIFIVDHTLELQHHLGGSGILQITLPSNGDVILGKLSFNSNSDLSFVNASIFFSSPWTEAYEAQFSMQESSSVTDYMFDVSYSDTPLLTLAIISTDTLYWYQSNLVVKATAFFLHDIEMKWIHSLDSENLASVEVSYGSNFYVQGKSHLNFSQGWLNKEFISYDFLVNVNITEVDMNLKLLLSIDSQYNGKVEGSWNDYFFVMTTALLDGVIFNINTGDSERNLQSEMKYEKRKGDFPNLYFHFARDGKDLFVFQVVFEASYPKVNALVILIVFSENNDTAQTGQLRLTADVTDIHNYAFKGTIEINSDLESFGNFEGSLEIDIKFNSILFYTGHVNGLFKNGDWQYKGNVNSSVDYSHKLSMECGVLYEVIYSNKTFDKKELSLVVNLTNEIFQTKLTIYLDDVSPHWSIHVYYNENIGDFRGLVMPGEPRKYEISCRLSNKIYTISAQRTDEDGSKFQYLKGNINWLIRKVKKMIIINMDSDIDYISKISGHVAIQQKRDLAVTAKLTVNQNNFDATMRYISHVPGSSSRITIKIENDIIVNFKTDVNLDISVTQEGLMINLVVDVNEDKSWFTGSLKLGLPESHLHLKMPITNWENFNLTFILKAGEQYGIIILVQVPQMCFNLTTSLDQSFLSLALSIDIQLKCVGNTVFEFNFKYTLEKKRLGVYCDLSVHDYGLLFKFNGTGHVKQDEIGLKIEAELYPQVSVGLAFLAQSKEEHSLRLQVYEPSSNTSYLVFRNSYSPTEAEVSIELLDDQLLLLTANYYIHGANIELNVTFSLSLSDFLVKMTLTGKTDIMTDFGNMELEFTSASSFDYANLSISYDFREEIKKANYKFMTTNGYTESEMEYKSNENVFSFITDMSSSLHTFQKYHMEFVHETEGMSESIKILSAQDDIEFHLNGYSLITGDKNEIKLTFSSSFEEYEKIEFEFLHPIINMSEVHYQAKLTTKEFGKTYVIDTRYNYHDSWKKQLLEITLITPELKPKDFSLLLTYNVLEGQGSVVLSTPFGPLGIEGTLKLSEKNVALSLTSHLIYLGEYKLILDIPLKLSQSGEIYFSHHHTALNFDIQIRIGEYFKNGNISFTLDSEPNSFKKNYSISYDFQNSFKIEGQFDDKKVMAKLSLNGQDIPALSGGFEIETNFKGYEAFDGSWNMAFREQVYIAQVNIEIKQQGNIAINAAIDIQPEGVSLPWDGVKLTILFESPFTLTHHLQAEYDPSPFSMAAYYQHGLDTFQIQWNSDFGNEVATVMLSGNIPVQGISSFSLNFRCDFTQSYSAGFVAKIEDMTFQSRFEFSLNWKDGSIMASLTSPFVKPVKCVLKWSFGESTISLSAICNVGEHSGELKMILEYITRFAHFNFQAKTLFEETSKFSIDFLYDISYSESWKAAFITTLNHHILNLKSNLMISEAKFIFKFTGFVDLFGINGSADVEFGIFEGIYKGNISGKIIGYEKFSMSFLLDLYQFNFNMRYKMKDVLVVSVNYYQTNLQLDWNDFWHFNLSALHKAVRNGHHFDLSFNGFHIEPLMLQAMYSRKRGHQFDVSLNSLEWKPINVHVTYSGFNNNQIKAQVMIGKETYSLVGKADIERDQSSFEMRLESPFDSNNPLIFKAMYNIKKFLRGKMNSVMNLAYVTFEWEEQFHLNVTGMRNENAAKINLTIITPFTFLPKLLLGFDGELSLKEAYVDLQCTAFMEWSERVSASGFFKLRDEKVDLIWALTTSYIGLKNLTISFQLKPGHTEATLLLNKVVWMVACDFEFSPTYLVVFSVKTPVTGFEKLSLTMGAETENSQLSAQAEITWPQAQTLGVYIKFEKMSMEINLSTPWESLKVGQFQASQTDENENITYSSHLQWNKRKIVTSIILLPSEFQFASKYMEENAVIVLSRFESAFEDRGFKVLFEIQTPFVFLKRLETVFHLESQSFSAKVVINDMTCLVEAMYSINGGKFKASIPILGDMKWLLEVKNMWMKMDTEITLSIPQGAIPVITSFSYEVEPQAYSVHTMLEIVSDRKWVSVNIEYMNTLILKVAVMDTLIEINVMGLNDGEASLNLMFESPNWTLNLFKFNVTARFHDYLELIDGSLSISVKAPNKKLFHYKLILGANITNDQLFANFEFQSDQSVAPYKITSVIPLLNIFFEEVNVEFRITRGKEELCKILYKTLFLTSLSSSRLLVIESSEWAARLQVDVDENSFSVSVSYPESSVKHTFLLIWSEVVSFEQFMIKGELDSPYLKDGSVEFNFNLLVKKNFHGILTFILSYGTIKVDTSVEFQYNRKENEIHTKFQITSELIGIFSIDLKAQWERNITAAISLNILGNEHSFRLHLDVIEYSLEIISQSSFLPFEEMLFTGKINSNFNLSDMNYEGKLIMEDREINIVAKLKNDNFHHINSYVIVKQNNEQVFTMSGKFYNDNNVFDIEFDMYSIISELNYHLKFRYEDGDEMRSLYWRLRGALLENEELLLKVINNKVWNNAQTLIIKCSILLDVDVDINRGMFYMKIVGPYKYSLEVKLNLLNEDFLNISFIMPFEYCELIKLNIHLPTGSYKTMQLVYSWSDVDIKLYASIENDDIFGKVVTFILTTPFKGFEKYALRTPTFKRNGQHISLLLELPSGKIGTEVYLEHKNLLDGNLKLRLFLPFESYDVISLQYIISPQKYYYILEARVGKVGFLLSFKETEFGTGRGIEAMCQLNEHSIKAVARDFSYLPNILRAYIHIDLDLKELTESRSFHIEYQDVFKEKFYFIVRHDLEELFKVNLAWGSDKIFAVSLPKVYPGSLIINLESTPLINDFHLELSFPSYNNNSSWKTYCIHVHQEALVAGHYIFLSGEGFNKQFHIEGSLSLNSFHFNQSLIFEINRKKIGSRVVLYRDQRLFSIVHTGDVYLILPSQSVHYKTNATTSSRELEIVSSFTWNEYDNEMPPVTFKLNYNDNSLYGNMEHYLKAVFSHPDIKDIIFQGNITQSHNSPLSGLAELLDGNSPEKNIVMMLVVQPVTENREHNILLNISQPFSKFAFSMDGQVTESVFTRGNYTLKYWSLIKETWEDLTIFTDVNTTNSGYEFAANFLISQGKWCYKYRGNINLRDNSTTFNIQGSRSEFAEFWKFGTAITKDVPELLMYVNVGEQDQEPYEKGRLRIGLHNPLELGAVLDHQRFSEWSQDGAFGLKLVTPNILQFFLEYDPSLDFNDDRFITRLTSPAYKVLNAWQHDITYIGSLCEERIFLEVTKIFETLVNKEAILEIWERETGNFDYFINEFNTATTNMNEDIDKLWTEAIQPSLHAACNLTTSLYEQSLVFLESFVNDLILQLSQLKMILKEKWIHLEDKISTLFTSSALWWMDKMQEVWQQVESPFLAKYSLLSAVEIEFSLDDCVKRSDVSECFQPEASQLSISPASKFLKDVLITVVDMMKSMVENIQNTVAPNMLSVSQALTSYSQKIEAVLRDECWKRIVDKLEVTATLREGASQVVSVVPDFLQMDKYYDHFIYTKDMVLDWIQNSRIIFEGGISQLQQAVHESWQSGALPLTEVLNKIQEAVKHSSTQIETEGIFQFVEKKISELKPKIKTATEETFNILKENLEALQSHSNGDIFFDYINVAAGNVFDRMTSTWEKWSTSERKNLDTLENFIFLLADNIHEILINKNYFLDELYVFDPKISGKIRYNQYLPVPWSSFLEAPQWYYLTNAFQDSSVVDAHRLLMTGVDDVSIGWQALTFSNAFIPPFMATATIAGQHVTTFDSKHYEFLGSCSYLLTKDFVTGDFEVVGVYKAKDGASNLESIVVHGHHIDVTLHVDGSVETNQVGAEVYMEDGYSALKMSDLLVTCSKISQGCSITVTGKYFNRLAGLLGNYNYEPSDDSHGPSGEKAYNVADLARMWAVSPNPCYQANQARQLHDISDAENLPKCFDLFLKSNSQLSGCFHAVDPRPYFMHCVNGQSHPAFTDEALNSPCNAVSSYRTQCWTQGIHLPKLEICLPKTRAMCNISGESVASGWSHIYQRETQGSADIALIVEQSSCIMEKDVRKLFKSLTDQLKKKRISDVRYAVVIMNEDAVSSSAFMNEREVTVHLGTVTNKKLSIAEGNSSTVQSAAAKLKWRPGVSRTVIEISCQPCNEGETITEVLKANDITYHLITKLKIIMAGPSDKKSKEMAQKVYGFDEKLVYMIGDYKDFKGNEGMRMALQEPNGACVMAAQASGGSVFNIYKWNSKKAVQEKKFLSVISQRVTLSANAPECQECHCINENTEAMVVCHKCSASLVFSIPTEKKIVKQNNTIIADIKKNFEEEF